MRDIKETKEMIAGLMSISCLIADIFKDGLDISDFMELFMKLKSDDRLVEAFKGMKEIPAELADLEPDEIIELASEVLKFIPQIIACMKKK